jgi:hypothetical protein
MLVAADKFTILEVTTRQTVNQMSLYQRSWSEIENELEIQKSS